jgi:hypothetical protein
MMVIKTSLHANHLPDNLHGIRTAIEKAVWARRRFAWKETASDLMGNVLSGRNRCTEKKRSIAFQYFPQEHTARLLTSFASFA